MIIFYYDNILNDVKCSLICIVHDFNFSSGKDVSESCILQLLRPVDSRVRLLFGRCAQTHP